MTSLTKRVWVSVSEHHVDLIKSLASNLRDGKVFPYVSQQIYQEALQENIKLSRELAKVEFRLYIDRETRFREPLASFLKKHNIRYRHEGGSAGKWYVEIRREHIPVLIHLMASATQIYVDRIQNIRELREDIRPWRWHANRAWQKFKQSLGMRVTG